MNSRNGLEYRLRFGHRRQPVDDRNEQGRSPVRADDAQQLNVRNTDRGARRRVIFNPWVRLFKSLWLLAKM